MKPLFVVIVMTGAIVAPLAYAQSENAGLLPSNPFYFLKEWYRGVKLALSFDASKKTELLLDILNKKALEIDQLKKIAPQDSEAAGEALLNYQKTASQLNNRIKYLLKNRPLLIKLLNHGLEHYEIFDARILAELLKEGEPADFAELLISAAEGQDNELKELFAAEIADYLIKNASAESVKDNLTKAREDLLIRFSGRLEAGFLKDRGMLMIAAVQDAPGDFLRRLRVLDQAREIVLNTDLKSKLNIARQQILETAAKSHLIRKGEAQDIINAASDSIAKVETEVGRREGAVSNLVNQLLARAKFNLDQAEQFYQNENYIQAFSQAAASYAAAYNGLGLLLPPFKDYAEELNRLEGRYDNLAAELMNADEGLELLGAAQKRILRISGLVHSGGLLDEIAILIRNTKLILTTLEE